MPDFLSVPKAKQAASTVFGLAGTTYRAALGAAVGALVAHQIAGPAGVLVGALAVILAASLFPPSLERTIAVFVAVTVASYAISDPALARMSWDDMHADEGGGGGEIIILALIVLYWIAVGIWHVACAMFEAIREAIARFSQPSAP